MTSRASMAMAGGRDRGHDGLCSASDGKVIGNEFLSSYAEVVRGLGGEPESLLREAGIEPASLHQAGGKISLWSTASLLAKSAAVLNCPDLGLRLAARQNPTSIMK